jgi:heme-degrading monooxygenase HmoA
LLDRDHPVCFVSFGQWESIDQIAAWRAHPGFRERVTRMN